MPAPKEVVKLIENFERNLDAYRSGKYNETQVRRDFIDPLWRWAVDFSQRVGLYAVVVDAKNGKVKAFYTKLGFIACMDSPLSLYLPVATLEQASLT